MIKTINILFLVIFFYNSMYCKTTFGIGVSSQINRNYFYNKLDYKTDESIYRQKSNFGYSIGLPFFCYFNKSMGIESGVFYTSRKWSYIRAFELPFIGGGATNEINSYYYSVSTPLLFTYKFNIKKINPIIKIGPMLDYTFKNKLYGEINSISQNKQLYSLEDTEYSYGDVLSDKLYNSLTISCVLGAGISYNISKHFSINPNLLVSYGVTDIENKKTIYVNTTNGYTYKTYPYPNYNNDFTRPQTHVLQYGVGLSFFYNFKK